MHFANKANAVVKRT